MKRLLYIICVLMSVACSKDIFEEGYVPSGAGVSSQISPSAYVSFADMPPAATKALINTSTVASMEANALRIDEKIGQNDEGTYEYDSWEEAYLMEATVSASPALDGLRSMYLNPVQAYKFKVVGEDTTDFYHTRMVSWYPRTAHLHKNSEGNAVITKFKDFKTTIDGSVYDKNGDNVVLNFSGLDGSKDVMVSNIVEGQHWHSNEGKVGVSEGDKYTYPFGDNSSAQSKYRNVMTYRHYMSAIKVYAYTENSEQDVSMWGALNKVMVKNQPSGMSVTLPSPEDMPDASVSDFVQTNLPSYGTAAFSSELTDFPLIKTPMYGEGGAEDQEVAPDSPHLEKNQEVYLGYALIRPNSLSAGNNGDSGQKLELEVHTDAGALTVEVDMTQTVDDVKQQYFQPGYIYTIRIKFNTEGAIAGIVMRAGDDHYYDLSSGHEFDEGVHDHKYANCYIVHNGLKRDEEYYDGFAFSATTIGNGPTGLYSGFYPSSVEIDPVRAGLLWESDPGLITHVEYIYGYVRFKVKQDANGYQRGNAVIAVYDSQRKVLWSWHIWVAGDEPQDVSYTVGDNKTIVLLDRNLGAVADVDNSNLEDTYGLYYQWGRKDPSMGPPSYDYLPQSTATIEYYDYYGMKWNYAGVVAMAQPTLRDGVENPMYLIMPTDFSMTTYQYDWLYTNVDNLWGDYDHSAAESTSQRLKTIYDPCPFGYMVPQDEISTLFATKSPDMVDEGTGYTIQGTREDDPYDSFFPFAGYKGVDKGVSSLTGAWKYVGHKGDYMSSKIEGNGHRSRTYISDTSSWIEYGADSDNDGDGDASRTYSSNIIADDMANRRTAASVRCVKRSSALNASLVASFVGDRAYAFVRDGKITFNYDVRAYGSDVSITSAMVDLDGVPVTPDPPVTVPQGGSTQISGSFSLDVPSTTTTGLARYRLIANTSKGSVSRVSYVLRLFDLLDVKIGEELLAQGNVVCEYGEKYPVSFTLKGLESDFSVYVNGVQAVKGDVSTDVNELSTINYSIESGVYVPGHLNIQIRDAEGGLACHKSYEVAMKEITSYQMGVYVDNVKDLEAGALYMIKTYQVNTPYWLTYSGGKLVLSSTSTPSANNVFLFHRDDTKAGGVSANYRNVSAGAWRNLAADAATPGVHDDGFFKENFGFGTETEAAYTTCANGWGSQTSEDIDLYLGSTGKFLYYRGNPLTLYWGTEGNYHSWKWVIYKVTVSDSE